MTRAEVLAELREVLNDKVSPYGWSDKRLLHFLSLGQDQFCKDTGFFRDASTYKLTTVAGTASYALSTRVIEVLRASIAGAQLEKFSGLAPTTGEGQPYAWQTDLEHGMVTLYPTPDAVYTVDLYTWRKSRIAFSASGDFDLPDDMHLAPVEWAAFLAFGDHDRELQDPVKAADHKARYNKVYVPAGKQAFRRLCRGHASFAPNPLYLV